MKKLITIIILGMSTLAYAQTGSVQGQLQDAEQGAVAFANVVLYKSADSSLYKVEASDEKGLFKIAGVAEGNYYLVASFVGAGEIKRENIKVKAGEVTDLEVLKFGEAAIELEAATVTASRVMVEVKPDRTIFNVQGTINSTGDDAMSLMRKAPGVMVDNNDNIVVLGRSGVQVFVDGKLIPLSGDDLTNYLRNIPSDQIDRVEIITNPGAKYDAEGNAGIIDIRLKKDKNLGGNGSINGTLTQGLYTRGNGGANANFRNKRFNAFANVGVAGGDNFNTIFFDSQQNGLTLEEVNRTVRSWENFNYRVGADFFINKKNTIGFLATGLEQLGLSYGDNEISIAEEGAGVDSILVAESDAEDDRSNSSFNLNYRYDDSKVGRSLNIDLDYGRYLNQSIRYQPNRYFDATGQNLLTEVINYFETPSDIQIYTARLDYEDKLWGGKFGTGLKYSKVVSDNTFLLFDEINGIRERNDTLSNEFLYDENVYAGYVNYTTQLNKKWGLSAGLRAEYTDLTGDLKAFLPELAEPPVEQNYLQWFPNVGITYQPSQMNSFLVSYGRRINRPDYNVLNPFNNQLSQISYQKGNPRLLPETVNNIELGYTYAYRYNFKVAYSKTLNQITRLIEPDEVDPRANFITWANLAEQTIFSFNASAPIQVNKFWNAYVNISASHIDNQADYSESGGGVVDVQAFTYNFYAQNTFNLPKGFKAEVSGWYSGPGVWGGVFLYESSWSLNLGLQKRFLNDQLNVRITANDLFYETGWDGFSDFNGLRTEGYGRWDSRFVSVSMSYNFGNQNVKSRRRKTGLEDEAGRVGN